MQRTEPPLRLQVLVRVCQKRYTRRGRIAMPTKNPHINIALEMHEDAVLARVADERVAALTG